MVAVMHEAAARDNVLHSPVAMPQALDLIGGLHIWLCPDHSIPHQRFTKHAARGRICSLSAKKYHEPEAHNTPTDSLTPSL